jgi:hypothetical protein
VGWACCRSSCSVLRRSSRRPKPHHRACPTRWSCLPWCRPSGRNPRERTVWHGADNAVRGTWPAALVQPTGRADSVRIPTPLQRRTATGVRRCTHVVVGDVAAVRRGRRGTAPALMDGPLAVGNAGPAGQRRAAVPPGDPERNKSSSGVSFWLPSEQNTKRRGAGPPRDGERDRWGAAMRRVGVARRRRGLISAAAIVLGAALVT